MQENEWADRKTKLSTNKSIPPEENNQFKILKELEVGMRNRIFPTSAFRIPHSIHSAVEFFRVFIDSSVAGVLKGGFEVVAGGAEARFTGKSCSSNKSPFLVNM